MLSATQAAFVADVEPRDIHHAIDRNVLPDRLFLRGDERRVAVEGCPLVAFYYASAKRLTAEERIAAICIVETRLRAAPSDDPWSRSTEDWIVHNDFLRIDLSPFVARAAQRWRLYGAARAMVVSDEAILSGTPIIAGTRIPVHDVAASLAAGHLPERVAAAYPSLSPAQIELAALYAKANPLAGRPRARPLLETARLVFEESVPRRPAG
ncbi:DUF433 domain-containing protein [Methylorubrum salsuginis]|uniref:Uncharacterized conserved protein, DUF433 family n=1 Tax=Methylorubrum salsuginis TaxID=414703 RepID=A0A1I4D0Q1_9HYPH|nr:DUF433 domain-containing protein [Methylorubrum salsuginis]SFK87128.1 Uncharacterized conserved protein, DUF433 family [Methylorubrum salsuginis]